MAGKGENASYHHFLLSHNVFKAFSLSVVESRDHVENAKMVISVLDRIENMVGKGEIADYKHFLLSSIKMLNK